MYSTIAKIISYISELQPEFQSIIRYNHIISYNPYGGAIIPMIKHYNPLQDY